MLIRRKSTTIELASMHAHILPKIAKTFAKLESAKTSLQNLSGNIISEIFVNTKFEFPAENDEIFQNRTSGTFRCRTHKKACNLLTTPCSRVDVG